MLSILNYLSNYFRFLMVNWKGSLVALLVVYSCFLTFLQFNSSSKVSDLKERHNREILAIKDKCERDLEKTTLKSLKERNEEKRVELEETKKVEIHYRGVEQERYDNAMRALQNAKQREKEIHADLIATANDNEQLHNTIRDLSSRVSKDTREAESRLRLAQQVSFQECTTRLKEMESEANRLANQLKEFDEAWPKDITKTENTEDEI